MCSRLSSGKIVLYEVPCLSAMAFQDQDKHPGEGKKKGMEPTFSKKKTMKLVLWEFSLHNCKKFSTFPNWHLIKRNKKKSNK